MTFRYGLNKRRQTPNGYVAIPRPGAAKAYVDSVPVTACGNNVNSFHVFGGWHLGYTVTKADIDAREDGWTFDELVNNFLFYLDRELGTYPVFYIKRADHR